MQYICALSLSTRTVNLEHSSPLNSSISPTMKPRLTRSTSFSLTTFSSLAKRKLLAVERISAFWKRESSPSTIILIWSSASPAEYIRLFLASRFSVKFSTIFGCRIKFPSLKRNFFRKITFFCWFSTSLYFKSNSDDFLFMEMRIEG